jgi:hypothetical protein
MQHISLVPFPSSHPYATNKMHSHAINAQRGTTPIQLTLERLICLNYFVSASRFSFAQALSLDTAFNGGPPSVPQAHGPSILASVMQAQDFVFRQAQT